MNEELSILLEHALQYASPLPVMSSSDDMMDGSPDISSSGLLLRQSSSSTLEQLCEMNLDDETNGNDVMNSMKNHLSLEDEILGDFHSNQNNIFQMTDQIIESPYHMSDETFNVRDEGISHFEIHVTESDFTGVEPVTEVNPDSTSGMINDINDIADACLRFENEAQPSADSTMCTGNSDVKPKVKKRRRREKNPDPPPPTILPPCDICNDKSSGYHYGANTCEACKGFYRRTLKKKEVDYRCKCKPDEKEAWKRGPYKNGCPACRYEKCLAVGMSKNAIKIGRYTLNHKTRNIKKIKSIETIDSLITALTETISQSSPPASSSGSDEVMTSPPSSDSISELSTTSSASGDGFQPIRLQNTDLQSGAGNPDISLKEIDYIVKTLTEAHTTLIVDERDNFTTESMREKQAEYLEKYRLKTELFGSMRNITHAEFKEFYNETGIDIDGRLERADTAFRYFEGKIAMVVAFAKAIPGFKQLSLDDQANLIKASRVETSLICSHKNSLRNLDLERRVITLPWGACLHLDELGKFFPKDRFNSRYKFAQQLSNLNLSVQEESILRAIFILFSDRCKLEEPEKVDALQEKMVTCLQHLISVRPGGPGTLLYKIFSLITNIRELTDKEMEFSKTLLVDWPMLNVNNYHLVREFLS